jgi:hypothetical protein
MWWLGWTFLPAKVGPFFEAADFERVRSRLRLWIWMYRVNLFGYLITLMAFVAFATLVAGSEYRIILWPAVATLGAGLLVGVLAAAFYYHFGAWGAVDLDGKPSEAVDAYVESLEVSTEYVTCFVRFGRVFFGFGQVILAIGLLLSGLLPIWLIVGRAVLGAAAMVVTMAVGENLKIFEPLFHLNAAWLAAIGVVVLVSGVNL